MIEGSSHKPLINGSGSRRPKNTSIRRIRIRICNTAQNYHSQYFFNLADKNINYYYNTVLRILIWNRIRKDPKLLAGTGSDQDPK
jgi:hypothetical protein